jgi:flagellin-like hook-associated protein FlgL
MSDIVLSASVRQNLLSLQSTAQLLATTQNRLSTGKKVNTALDNPTNYFTAAGLDNRASDINNLLDSIGNGVQVVQAANTGITSLQKLVDTAKSIANQVLQAPAGYLVKASATTAAPTGAGPLGVAGTAADLTNAGTNSLNGKTFVFTPAAGAATTITVSSTVAAGNVNSIDNFNAALESAGIGLTASLAADGSISFTSTNDNASQILTLGTTAAANTVALSGTGTFALVTPAGGSAGNPLADAASQTIRANLVAQYNNIITQITTTAQDSSFNGINLLNGDDLKLTFNETGKSTLTIKGVTFNAAGLGLAPLTSGTDFLDNASAKATITVISSASNTLRSQASALGSNLSVVQIRQDFNKNLINVLQTGSSNLTLADTNEEAANSQALSTRQSIAVSALALANQSQQSVLQLLR